MAIRFVRPETVTVTLADGTTLVVKKELTAGEQRKAHARLFVEGRDGKLRVDPLETGIGLISAYLLDWNVNDEPIRGLSADELEAILNRLAPESFTELKDAIEAHERAVIAERTEKKTSPAIANTSDRIFTSVS